MQFMYKGESLNEPGNVDFGSHDISEIGDGTVTGAIVYLNDKLSLLWTNEDMSANFPAQIINIAKRCDLYLILFKANTATNIYMSVICERNSSFKAFYVDGFTEYRVGSIDVNGNVTIDDAKYVPTYGSPTTDHVIASNYLIPYRIYGIKM